MPDQWLVECVGADVAEFTIATNRRSWDQAIPSPLLLLESPCLLPAAGFLAFTFHAWAQTRQAPVVAGLRVALLTDHVQCNQNAEEFVTSRNYGLTALDCRPEGFPAKSKPARIVL